MWELGKESNWSLVLRRNYQASPSPSAQSKFIPIPSITANVNSYTLLIGASNPQAQSHWFLGGYASPRLLFAPSANSEFLSLVQSSVGVKFGLERLTLINFPNYNLLPYILEINVARWHKEIMLEVWQYNGSTENVQSSLDRIEYKIDNLAF